MIERCFDSEQGFYWAVSAGSVEEFQRKVQPVPFILPDGSEIRPGMTTDLLGYNFKPAEYVGLMKVCKEDRWSELIFLLGEEVDLFDRIVYYDEVLFLQDSGLICQMTPYGSARNWVFKDGKWK